MKRIKKRRKVLTLALVMVVCMVATLSMSATVFAEGYRYEGTGTFDGSSASLVNKGDKNPEVSIPVRAKITGGQGVVYIVDLTWGAMQFEYDYGSTWDSEQHKYTPGASGKPGGGWNMDQVDGNNNKITVTNGGNFPVSVGFTYEMNGDKFGEAPGGKHPVGGVFDYNLTSLQTNVEANVLNPAGYAVPANMILNPPNDEFVWSTGDPYYFVGTDNNENINTIYFSLMGTPALGLTMDPWDDVGTIKATISPATGVTQAYK